MLLDLLFPPRCVFCHRFLERKEKDNRICDTCLDTLPVLERKERWQNLPGIDACSSLFRYEGAVRDSILRYKFHGLSFYGRTYAALLARYLTNEELECDVITWVPLSQKRLRSRGYDQAKILADHLAEEIDRPCLRLIKKVRNAVPQSGIGGREERKSNIHDAYRTCSEQPLQGKTILLIDDIVTTGATLSECASVIRTSGVSNIKAVTLARTDLHQ